MCLLWEGRPKGQPVGQVRNQHVGLPVSQEQKALEKSSCQRAAQGTGGTLRDHRAHGGGFTTPIPGQAQVLRWVGGGGLLR